MRDIFYREMRNRIEEIRALDPKTAGEDGIYPVSEADKSLFEVVDAMIELARVARREGILFLEMKTGEYRDKPWSKYLMHMISLIVNGTGAELTEEIALGRYFASNLTDYGALCYLIILYGILAIRKGENPMTLEDNLVYILPEELTDEYIRHRKESKKIKAENSGDVDLSIVDKVCEGGLGVDLSDACYYMVRLMDQLFRSVKDTEIQRLLRDVENSELMVLMKAISGKARRRIFDSVSPRLAVMFAEDLIYNGPVRTEAVGEAAKDIFTVFLKLIEADEIKWSDADILRDMSFVFFNAGGDESYSNQGADEAVKHLRELWREYEKNSHKMIDLPCNSIT
ncbi:MAG: hypothetical protein K6F54_11490 [Lachnospiraceae bacterium]|nr:hypothetical protein [Lachnospiraceae bacterium]